MSITGPELLTGRQAADVLGRVGLSREQARRLLHTGLAGPAIRTRGALLYDAGRVMELADWPTVDPTTIDPICQAGVFVARLPDLDAYAPPADLDARVADGWQVSATMRLQLRVQAQRAVCVPFVATVSGYVVLGADLIDVRPMPAPTLTEQRCRLELQPAGTWFEGLRARRLVTSPGGPWTLWVPGRKQAPRRQDSLTVLFRQRGMSAQ
jgi:hypothetical protein